MDVARHLRSSEEVIITSASSDEEGSIVIFQQISQEGSEVRIRVCGGHGFPVYSLPGLKFSEKYKETTFGFFGNKRCVQNGFEKG